MIWLLRFAELIGLIGIVIGLRKRIFNYSTGYKATEERDRALL